MIEFETFVCEQCNEILKPLCNMKRHKGKVYCVRCYRDIIYPS